MRLRPRYIVLAVWLAVVVVLAYLAAGRCRDGRSSAPTATPLPTASPAPGTPVRLFPRVDVVLERANAAMKALNTAHLEGEVHVKADEQASTDLVSGTIQMDRSKERTRLVLTLSLNTSSGRPTATVETRDLGGIRFQRVGTGDWQVISQGALPVDTVLAQTLKGELALDNNVTQLLYLDAVPAFRIIGAAGGDPRAQRVTAWAALDTLRFQQVTVEGAVAANDYARLLGVNVGAGRLFQSILVRVSRFDVNVQIDAPQL